LKKNGSGMVVLGVDPGSMEMVDDAESHRDQGKPQYPITRLLELERLTKIRETLLVVTRPKGLLMRESRSWRGGNSKSKPQSTGAF
jgi:hypothetical protein